MKPASSNTPSTKATTWCQTTYTYEITYNSNGSFNFNIISESTTCWEVYDCEEEIGGGGSGSYEGGDTSTDGQKYTPLPNDKLFKATFTKTMETQVPNTCVPSVMAYIHSVLCEVDVNYGTYVLDYYQTYGINILSYGVSLENITPFVSKHFNLGNYSTFKDAIDNGNIVMTDIRTGENGSTHNVAVVGYRQSGELIYMDPELGYLCQSSTDIFVSNYFLV